MSEIASISEIPISRYAQAVTSDTLLCGFCDSSNDAYAAVLYLRSSDGTCNLVFCRARVCPLKQRTLPEMELEAAKLLALATAHVAQTLQIPLSNCRCWSDSMIVLAWLKKPLQKLKVVVANRVALINDCITDVPWAHVDSANNPADLPSRGISASSLLSSKLWWNGPLWLSRPEQNWPRTIQLEVEHLPGMKKDKVVTLTMIGQEFKLWTLYSDYRKLTKILAWMLKFVRNARKSTSTDETTTFDSYTLCFSDIQAAKMCLILQQQKESFPVEIDALSHNKQIQHSSKLWGLCSTM